MRNRRRPIALAAAVTMLAVAPASRADPVLPLPVRVSTDSANGATPVIAADAKGDAVLVWSADAGGDTEIQASVREAGGAFGPPHTFSVPGDFAYEPGVVMDAAGDATVMWGERLDGGTQVVQVSDRPAGGSWSDGQTVAEGLPQSLATDAAGDELLAWVTGPLAATELRVKHRPHGQPFPPGRPAPIETATFGSTVQAKMDAAGDGALVWTRDTQVMPSLMAHLEAVHVSRTGATDAPKALTAVGDRSFAPAMVLGAGGDATIAYDHWPGSSGGHPRVEALTYFAAGAVGPPQPLSPDAAAEQPAPVVAIDGAGRVTAGWSRVTAAAYPEAAVVESATAEPAAPFTVPATALDGAGRPGTSDPIGLASSPDGQTLVAWTHADGTVDAAFRAAGASGFGVVQPLGGGVSAPVASFGSASDAVLAVRRQLGEPGDPSAAYPIFATSTPYVAPAQTGTQPPPDTSGGGSGAPPADTSGGVSAPPPPPGSGPPVSTTTKKKALTSAAKAVRFPSASGCARSARFAVRLRVPAGAGVVKATVRIGAKVVATVRGARLRSSVAPGHLPKGRFTVTVTFTLTTGHTLSATRRFRACSAKHR